MTKIGPWVFSFEEADHLTRIHLKLALEDVGFAVAEEVETIRIAADCAYQPDLVAYTRFD